MPKTTTNHLSRPVMLHLRPSGALEIQAPGQDTPQGALPVFSVDTVKDAEGIQVALCKLSREDNKTYHLPFSGNVDHMRNATQLLDEFYSLRKEGVTGPALWAPMQTYKAATGVI